MIDFFVCQPWLQINPAVATIATKVSDQLHKVIININRMI